MPSELNDHACMAQAIRLAKKGLYTARVNPRVGCVVMKEGRMVGQGYHALAGQPHAEINALRNASESVENSTVYVTLEPCAHQGKTPPCVESLVSARVRRVVAAILDPNPLVNGKGLAYLNHNGVETHCNVLEQDALEINKGFILRMRTGRPYVTVKSAVSLDGKTALANGRSKWITGQSARLDVQKLRARSCAILSGIGTVLADDPLLTVRLPAEHLGLDEAPEQPLRVILDTDLSIPESARVLQAPGKAVVYTGSKDIQKIDRLRSKHIDVVIQGSGSLELAEVLHDLGQRGINEVLVEAGATVVGSLLDHGLVDEMVIYLAPHLIGDTGRALARLPLITDMQNRLAMQIDDISVIGQDIRLKARPARTAEE
ncbi:MAG: bifunctional diaminohydroxyphosphoribosylaminopyrimidine deaminase/5-amino-6-(5-phosphoribosylamino)uracil reductase RibD [Gammaproteobacteria bacterium]|nr:bifunctional diaminohydroxyphosphoribosylaminopyrimidine deaminase/5-amino-6-(5-phosphoribosylamino)uracil reductase RibD [Gammaproteobacteria bacterium]